MNIFSSSGGVFGETSGDDFSQDKPLQRLLAGVDASRTSPAVESCLLQNIFVSLTNDCDDSETPVESH